MPLRTLVFICCFGINLVMSLDCLPPGSTPCTTEPLCCKSGYFTEDPCNGCRECLKAKDEVCGGLWDGHGHCVPGLSCKNSTQYNPGKCMKDGSTNDLGYMTTRTVMSKAPKCDSSKEGFCSCALEDPRTEDQPELIKNCLPIYFFGEGKEGRYGYCFLENIQDFKNPTKNCHADTEWSVTHSRFYSYKACENYTPYQDEHPLNRRPFAHNH